MLLPYKTLTENFQVCLGKTMLPNRHLSRSFREFIGDMQSATYYFLQHNSTLVKRRVSGFGYRHPTPGYLAPAVAMIGWHVARLLGSVPSLVGIKNQNGVDVQAISNLAIGFPLFGTRS